MMFGIESNVISKVFHKDFSAYHASADFYKAVVKSIEEKYGRRSVAHKRMMNEIYTYNGRGSQFLFNNEAGLLLPENQRIARYDDLGRISDVYPSFFYNIRTSTPEIILRTEKSIWEENTKVLKNLVNQVRERGLDFSTENPLVLSDLELIKDEDKNNFYGILLKFGNKTSARNDRRFGEGNKKINLGGHPKELFTESNGLSDIALDENRIVSYKHFLHDSDCISRVIIFEDIEETA